MGNCQYNNHCKSYLEQGNLTTTSQMNVIDQLTHDFLLLPGNQDFNHPLYGKIDILTYKEYKIRDFKLAHKVLIFETQEQYQQAVVEYEGKYQGLNHPNLLIIHALQYKQIEQFFETQFKISLFLDYPHKTLAQEMLHRKKMYFEESEILYFLDSMIGALAFLQSKGLSYPKLRFDSIYLSPLYNGALGLKILNPINEATNEYTFKEVMKAVQAGKEVDLEQYTFLSPEELWMVREKKMESYNESKSLVFTLGLMALEMSCVRKSILLYKNFQLDENLMQEHIEKITDRYSEQIKLILQAMLITNPASRGDFLDFDEIMNSSSLKGRRINQLWTIEDYQFCVSENRRVHFSTKQQSLAHPEINSQLSNQSIMKNEGKGSYLSIKQVISKNSKESKCSSSVLKKKEQYSPSIPKSTLFKKYETEQASRGGSKKLIGNPDGFTIESQADGLTYEGYLMNGKKEGAGKLINDDNEVIYEGNFHENLYHGFGILINQTKLQFTEPFNYKDFSTLDNRWSLYQGEFKDGMKHGMGQLMLCNAERYSGQFQEGKVHGKGWYFQLDGKQIKAVWESNKFVELDQS